MVGLQNMNRKKKDSSVDAKAESNRLNQTGGFTQAIIINKIDKNR